MVSGQIDFALNSSKKAANLIVIGSVDHFGPLTYNAPTQGVAFMRGSTAILGNFTAGPGTRACAPLSSTRVT